MASPTTARVAAWVVPGLASVIALVTLGWSRPTPSTVDVAVDIRHSRFVPALVEVPAGTRVRFTVRNRDPIGHEFLVGDKKRQVAHELGTEARHGARPGELSLAPYEEATTTFRFARPGSVLIGCHLPGHWDYGMRGRVIVR